MVIVSNGYYRAVYKQEVGFVHFDFIDGTIGKFAANGISRARPKDYKPLEYEPDTTVLYNHINIASPLKAAPIYSAKTIQTIPSGTILKITQESETY